MPAGIDAATNIPVIVINGEKRGPVLALVSGAHGTEYTSIIALERLINLLDSSQIADTVILVPLVNIQSFEQKAPHVNPIDSKSMNRFYPWESRSLRKTLIGRSRDPQWRKGNQSGKANPE